MGREFWKGMEAMGLASPAGPPADESRATPEPGGAADDFCSRYAGVAGDAVSGGLRVQSILEEGENHPSTAARFRHWADLHDAMLAAPPAPDCRPAERLAAMADALQGIADGYPDDADARWATRVESVADELRRHAAAFRAAPPAPDYRAALLDVLAWYAEDTLALMPDDLRMRLHAVVPEWYAALATLDEHESAAKLLPRLGAARPAPGWPCCDDAREAESIRVKELLAEELGDRPPFPNVDAAINAVGQMYATLAELVESYEAWDERTPVTSHRWDSMRRKFEASLAAARALLAGQQETQP